MKAYIILIVLLILITTSLFVIQQNPSDCTCSGISLGTTYCLGSVNCQETKEDCIALTCDTKYDLLGTINSQNTQSQTYTILIIDASKSMEGENLEATKRASKTFVQQISEQQYVAIVEFNDKATKLTDFSNNKVELFNSIDLIKPQGKTKFQQPFAVANELFAGVPEEAGKYILFLSDGAPEDEPSLFLAEIEKLKKIKVNTYALAFSGKGNDEIMKQIASKDSNLYLVSTAEEIEQKFAEAYENILQGGDISLQLQEQLAVSRSEEYLKATVISNHNNANVLANTDYCPLQATHYIEAKKENIFSRILGVQKDTLIEYRLADLNSGTYELIGHTKIFLDECTMSTTTQFGSIQIANEVDCDITCEDINKAMRGTKNESYVRDNHQGISWNIFIDKSSSMNLGQHLDKAILDTSTLLSFMPLYDEVSLGSFDRRAELYTIRELPSPIQSKALRKIIPSASTQLLAALKKAKELENGTSMQLSHTIIITDGNYGAVNLAEIKQTIQSIDGCISTINYGTHLLRVKEAAHDLITTYRKCGEDFMTQPTRNELLNFINSNLTTTPELILRTQKIIEKNLSSYRVQAISTFTGITPTASNENCELEPLTQVTIQKKNTTIEQLSGNEFITDINESFTITASFDKNACSYETIKKVTFTQPKKSNTIKILSIIVVVLAIHIIVFTFILHRRLKKVEKNIKAHKKK